MGGLGHCCKWSQPCKFHGSKSRKSRAFPPDSSSQLPSPRSRDHTLCYWHTQSQHFGWTEPSKLDLCNSIYKIVHRSLPTSRTVSDNLSNNTGNICVLRELSRAGSSHVYIPWAFCMLGSQGGSNQERVWLRSCIFRRHFHELPLSPACSCRCLSHGGGLTEPGSDWGNGWTSHTPRKPTLNTHVCKAA